jgi:hypothetical protein
VAEAKPALNSKWREEHREFQNAIRAANGKAPLRSEYRGSGGTAGGSAGGGGTAASAAGFGGSAFEREASSGPSHFIPCPHCGRT